MVSIKLKKILLLFSLAMNLGFLLLALYFYGADRAGHGAGRKEHHMPLYERLDLTSEQAASISGLVREYAAGRNRMRQENKNLEKLLIGILMEKNPDREQLNRILDRIAALKRMREQLTAEHLLKVKQVLDDEQALELFSELLERAEKESKENLR